MEWVARIPALQMGSRSIVRSLQRSYDDLGALRIEDPEHPAGVVVAAGCRGYDPVGRDSLWASENGASRGPVPGPGHATDAGRPSGPGAGPDERGGTRQDPARGPSRRRRRAVLARKPEYHGSVDATPLFVSVLGAVSRWGFAKEPVAALLPNADRDGDLHITNAPMAGGAGQAAQRSVGACRLKFSARRELLDPRSSRRADGVCGAGSALSVHPDLAGVDVSGGEDEQAGGQDGEDTPP